MSRDADGAAATAFLDAYAKRLHSLRSASKPAITSLTMIADENRALAPRLASLILGCVEKLPPARRLPQLYLMDSILKNLKGEFVKCFAPHVERVIVSSFTHGPPDLRHSLTRLVDTWMAAKTFPVPIVQSIQMQLNDSSAPERHAPAQPHRRDPRDPRDHRNHHPRKRERSPGRYNEYPPPRRGYPSERGMPPPPPHHHPHPQSREEMWRLLEAQVNMYPQLRPQFEHIRTLRLRGLDTTEALDHLSESVRRVRQHAPPPPHHLPQSYPAAVPPLHYHQPQPLQPYPVNVPQPADVSSSSDALDLMKTLDQLGTSLGLVSKSTKAPEVDFSSISLRKPCPSSIRALYDDFPLQCEYCALRMSNKDEMAEHLDWHFQINREQKKREKQSSSQLWFMDEDEWIRCSGADEREAAPSYFDMTMAAQAAEEEKEKLAEKQIKTVPADNGQTDCHSCGEAFERFWDDNSEEWLYRDAMYLPGINGDEKKIVHQSCHEPDAVSP